MNRVIGRSVVVSMVGFGLVMAANAAPVVNTPSGLVIDYPPSGALSSSTFVPKGPVRRVTIGLNDGLLQVDRTGSPAPMAIVSGAPRPNLSGAGNGPGGGIISVTAPPDAKQIASFTSKPPVPEPGAIAALLTGLGGLALTRSRRR